MNTECTQRTFDFQGLGSRIVTARFDGGTITSDAGGLLLREIEAKTGIIREFAECFDDFRDPDLIEFTADELLKQRIFALALGYEDLNDHETLRRDPLLAVLVEKFDPTGESRRKNRDRGSPLAGKSTLNRLELTGTGASKATRYKKIAARHKKVESYFVKKFLDLTPEPPEEIMLDFDATDDTIHGQQLGRFYHGYYGDYCYLPLYIFCGSHLLCAKLRPSDIDASAGSVKQLARIVAQIRQRWPQVRIIIRGDSGFCRENLMQWCETNQVDFVLGMAKNKVLSRIIGGELQQAKLAFEASGEASRVFKDFEYRTQKSWSRKRRMIGKAEHLDKGPNPRFVVTSLSAERLSTREVYEKAYCGRGDMENRIKEQQRFLFADRTSCHTMRANQLRLWLSSVAYVLMNALRIHGLAETPLAAAQCDTIRLKLLKIGARVQVTVRRVWFSLAESYPLQTVFAQVFAKIRRWSLPAQFAREAPA